MAPWKCHVSQELMWGSNREASQPKHLRTLSISIDAGVRWLSEDKTETPQPKCSRNLSFHLHLCWRGRAHILQLCPHLDSELPFYSARVVWLPTPRVPPRLWETQVAVAGSGSQPCPSVRITWGSSAPPQSSVDTPEKWSQISRLGCHQKVMLASYSCRVTLGGNQAQIQPRLESFHLIDVWPPVTWFVLSEEIQHF